MSQYALKRSRSALFLSNKIKTLAKLSFLVLVSVTNEQKDKNKCVCSYSVICLDGSNVFTVNTNY